MATITKGDLIDTARSGRILQVINAQGNFQTEKIRHNLKQRLFSAYDNLYDDLQDQLSDNADENYAEIISIQVKPNLVIDNAVVMYEPHGQVDKNLLVHAILTQAKVAEQSGATLTIPYGLSSSLSQADWDNIYDRIKHISNLWIVELSVVERDEDEDDDNGDDLLDRLFTEYPYSDSYNYPYDDRDDDGSEFE